MSRLILGLTLAVLAGCSVSPAPLLTIPQGHPANPESDEAPYVEPPNPFRPGAADPPPPPKKPYPLDVCVVGGEKLGSMGAPVVLQHEGREVRLCCPACVDKFKQDPAKYLKKLDEHEGHR